MKFTILSSDFSQALLPISKVIPQKAALPILENVLLCLEGNTLTLKGSDQETTLITTITVEGETENGCIAVPAALITNIFKELPGLQVKFETIETRSLLSLTWSSGNTCLPFVVADEYPELPALEENSPEIKIKGSILAESLNGVLYATSDEPLRPVMNGIYFDIKEDMTNFVASNAQKLVCIEREDVTGPKSSFILPKKPAMILKNYLTKFANEFVSITFDKKNAFFRFGEQVVACRLIEGVYPNYSAVIPKNNGFILTLSKNDLLNATKRVAVCANQATGQIILKVGATQVEITSQDLDLSTSAKERIDCTYEGEPMTIAFKSQMLIEILSNLPSEKICIKLAAPNKAALVQPAEQIDENQNIFALLMPMRL